MSESCAMANSSSIYIRCSHQWDHEQWLPRNLDLPFNDFTLVIEVHKRWDHGLCCNLVWPATTNDPVNVLAPSVSALLNKGRASIGTC